MLSVDDGKENLYYVKTMVNSAWFKESQLKKA